VARALYALGAALSVTCAFLAGANVGRLGLPGDNEARVIAAVFAGSVSLVSIAANSFGWWFDGKFAGVIETLRKLRP
jgi:hypothetical protein